MSVTPNKKRRISQALQQPEETPTTAITAPNHVPLLSPASTTQIKNPAVKTNTASFSFSAIRANLARKKRVQKSLNTNSLASSSATTILQPNYWDSFIEESNEHASQFCQMRKDCFVHHMDILSDEMNQIRNVHKGDDTVVEVEKFVMREYDAWKVLQQQTCQTNEQSCLWWLSLPIAVVQCDLGELNEPFKLFYEKKKQAKGASVEDEQDTLVFHIHSMHCKSTTTLLKYLLENELDLNKVKSPSFDTIVKWYSERREESDGASFALVFVWDDIDAVPPSTLNRWIELCHQKYKSVAVYNVLRVSRVKSASVLQSIFMYNIAEKLNIQVFKTQSSSALVFYKTINQLFLKKNSKCYVRPGYHMLKFMFDYFHQKSTSNKDFKNQIKFMLEFFYQQEPLSFMPAVLFRFTPGHASHKMVLDSLLPFHKRRLCQFPSVRMTYDEKVFHESFNEMTTSAYLHFLFIPHLINLIEKLYRSVIMGEIGESMTPRTSEDEDEEILLLRINIYLSVMEKKDIGKSAFVVQVFKTLENCTAIDTIVHVLSVCTSFLHELNNEPLLKGQLEDAEEDMKKINDSMMNTFSEMNHDTAQTSTKKQKTQVKQLVVFLYKFFNDYYTHYRDFHMWELFYFDVTDVEQFFSRSICSMQMDLLKRVTESIADSSMSDDEEESQDENDDEEKQSKKKMNLTKDLAIGYATYKNCGESSRQFHMLEWLDQFARHIGESKDSDGVQARFALVVRSMMHTGYVKGVNNQPWVFEKQLL